MTNKVWTIPNILTIIRLLLLPLFVFVATRHLIFSAIFISLLALTDLLDGVIARRYHQESPLGRILDPISDRALTLVSFLTFFVLGALPLAFVVVVGLREVIVSVGTLIIAQKKSVRLDVNMQGKVSAFGAMAATPMWVVAHETSGSIHSLWIALALIAAIIAVIAGYWSLISYIKAYKVR